MSDDQRDMTPIKVGDHVLYQDGELMHDALFLSYDENETIGLFWVCEDDQNNRLPKLNVERKVPHGRRDGRYFILAHEVDR